MGLYDYKNINNIHKEKDKPDDLYQGHLNGYTYTGGGHYSNNGLGKDEWVTETPGGNYEWHSDM